MRETGQGAADERGSGGAKAAPRPLVIANPAARRGRTGHELTGLVAPLREALGELDVAPTERRGHAEQLAAAAVSDGRPLVISLGGDGTLNEVVNGLLGATGAEAGERLLASRPATTSPPPAASLPRLGIVETGTGGDFGRSLGIPHRLEAYIAAIASGRERPVDVGIAHFRDFDGRPMTRYWINVLSGGIGGLVDLYNETAPDWLSGRIAYGQAAFRGIVTCPRVTLRCRALLPDGSSYERLMHTHAVAICNGHTFGGGMLIGPAARPDDGLLQVVSFETRTKLQLMRRFLTVYRGTHVLEVGVNSLTCASVELTPADEGGPAGPHGLFPLDVDGDARGDAPVAVELLAGALLVRA